MEAEQGKTRIVAGWLACVALIGGAFGAVELVRPHAVTRVLSLPGLPTSAWRNTFQKIIPVRFVCVCACVQTVFSLRLSALEAECAGNSNYQHAVILKYLLWARPRTLVCLVDLQ